MKAPSEEIYSKST